MHFTIVGAGAMGGTLGAYLIRAGHDVLFVDSAREHVEAINAGGLGIEGVDEFRVAARAVTVEALSQATAVRPLAAVLLAVKAPQTAAALEPLVPLLRPEAFVVSLQNGLNERVIAARIGAANTVGAFINYAADYLAPGRIMYGAPGAFYLGELDGRTTPRLEALTSIVRGAFLDRAQMTDNIWGYLWSKTIYGSMLMATALVDEATADVLDSPGDRSTLANLAGEVVEVADAEDIRLEPFDGFDPRPLRFTAARDWNAIHRMLDARVAVSRKSLKTKTGVWRDLAVRHRRTEVDAHLGTVVEIGETHGLSLPLNRRLIELIHDLEEGRRKMHPGNLAELRTLNERLYPQ
jgi:2-dehydropantoate 2-reductase